MNPLRFSGQKGHEGCSRMYGQCLGPKYSLTHNVFLFYNILRHWKDTLLMSPFKSDMNMDNKSMQGPLIPCNKTVMLSLGILFKVSAFTRWMVWQWNEMVSGMQVFFSLNSIFEPKLVVSVNSWWYYVKIIGAKSPHSLISSDRKTVSDSQIVTIEYIRLRKYDLFTSAS